MEERINTGCRKKFQVLNDTLPFCTGRNLQRNFCFTKSCSQARSVQVDNILIELFYFDSTTSLVPFKGVSTSLTPDANMISYREWWQLPSVKGPSFSSLYMLFLRTSSLLLSVVSDSFWSGNMGPPKRHMAGEGPV